MDCFVPSAKWKLGEKFWPDRTLLLKAQNIKHNYEQM